MVLFEHDCSPSRWQAPGHCRARICLLKGCEEWFSPDHPRARYCSAPCRDAARGWSVWQAGRRYRASEGGKECRRQQACRYRQRVRQRRAESEERPAEACEGHQKGEDSEKIPCSRPGCYELFSPERRSPLKKFCSCLCREALRRVLKREARWGWHRLRLSDEDRFRRFHGPPDGFD